MEGVSYHLVKCACQLARAINARTLVLYADAICGASELRSLTAMMDYPVILVTRTIQTELQESRPSQTWVMIPEVRMERANQVKIMVRICLDRGLLQRGDRVVFLTGIEGSCSLDTLLVLDIGTDPELFAILDSVVLPDDVLPRVFERVLTLAAQLAAEGREGRPLGALFVIGDNDAVLAQSRRLVLNPFEGYPESERNILDPELEETIKEFAALDGAFIIRGDGVVLTAGTQLVPTVPHAPLPGGLGTRHAAAAGITASSAAVALCISQSTGTLSVFQAGKLVADIHRPGD